MNYPNTPMHIYGTLFTLSGIYIYTLVGNIPTGTKQVHINMALGLISHVVRLIELFLMTTSFITTYVIKIVLCLHHIF